jgi:hypothetical protein
MNLQLVLLALLAPLATARTSEPSVTTSAASAQGRVIVLGFDGADGRTVAEMMEKGELPNLAKLRAQGTFAPLGTTDPAESPVAWASLNSGRNPAETAIPGFVVRTFSPVPAIGDNPFKGKLGPSPTKGFAEDGVQVPIEELPTPIPSWSPLAFAAAVFSCSCSCLARSCASRPARRSCSPACSGSSARGADLPCAVTCRTRFPS